MAPQSCSSGSCGKGAAALGFHALLEFLDDGFPVVRTEIGIERLAVLFLVELEYFLEAVMLETEHHGGIHLDEAAVGIVGEALVARALGEPFHGLVVEAQIEHRVHHAGHGGASARAHRDEERVPRIAEAAPGKLRHARERGSPRPP